MPHRYFFVDRSPSGGMTTNVADPASMIERRFVLHDQEFLLRCDWYVFGHLFEGVSDEERFKQTQRFLGSKGLKHSLQFGFERVDDPADATVLAYGEFGKGDNYVNHVALVGDGFFHSKFGEGHVWRHTVEAVSGNYGDDVVALAIDADVWGQPVDSSLTSEAFVRSRYDDILESSFLDS